MPLPIGKTPITSQWVYKVKLKVDGQVDKLKARLVARGFEQEQGVDYQETVAPTVKSVTIILEIFIATKACGSLNTWTLK